MALTEDRLVDYTEISWLLWSCDAHHRLPDFPAPVMDAPYRWSRNAVLTWQMQYQRKRICLKLAWTFIQQQIPLGGE